MEDGSLVESVIIPAAAAENGEQADRITLCVSSQVGCAFGCKFCASGLLGLKRNLTTGEIIGQILSAEAIAGKRVNNLVFMGMGEPLSNFDNLEDALEIITSHRGLEIGARHITISTSGFVPGLKKTGRLSQANPSGRLPARSHGRGARPDHAGQQKKMAPLPAHSRVGGMGEGQEPDAHAGIHPHPGRERLPERRIPSRPDRQAPARQGQPHSIQHCGEAPGERPAESRCRAFRDAVHKARIPVTMRYEKGHDINAACGQLRLRKEREKQRWNVPLTEGGFF